MSRDQTAIPAATMERAARIPDVVPGVLHRATSAAREQPWWFSNRDGPGAPGRFDLEGKFGTCYLAETEMVALLERFTDPDDLEARVPVSALESTAVWTVQAPPPASVADTTDPVGGLPKEIGAGTNYRACWAWADRLHADGREGLRYWSRMAPDASCAVAVFGPMSTVDQPADGDVWPAGTAVRATRWRDELVVRGIVAEVPTLGSLLPGPPPPGV